MSSFEFTVAIPWRMTPSRKPLFNALTAWYEREMNVHVQPFGDSLIPHENMQEKHFHTAKSRNLCVQESLTEIVVINDADTIPDKEALLQAIDYVNMSGLACLPYTRYNHVDFIGTQNYLTNQIIDKRHCKIYKQAVGGIIVTTKQVWARHNGQDERMIGWGYQDTAWHLAYETLIGDIKRIDADIYSLAHQLAPRTENIKHNSTHFEKYLKARGNFEEMSLLVSGNRLQPN